MNIVIFFSSVFCDWPLKLVEHMREKQPDIQIIALTNDNDVYKKLKNLSNTPLKEVHNFNDLEKQWTSDSFTPPAFTTIEEELGSNLLLKTLIADKNLGKNWLKDSAVLYNTPLSSMLEDHRKQRQYLAGLYGFLIDIYRKHKPALSFVYAVAGGLSYAVAATSRHFGVPSVQLQGGRIDNIRILDTSIEGLLEPVQHMVSEAKQSPTLLEPLWQEAQEKLVELRKSKAKPSIINYVENNRKQATKLTPLLRASLGCLIRISKKILKPDTQDLRAKPERQKFFYNVVCKLRRNNKATHKYFHDFKLFKDQDYVYFPLHLDPEASTLVYSPYHTNQLAVIEALSKQIPLSSHLLVKEHPVMLGQRPLEFYKKIDAMPNVTMITPHVPGDLIIKNASIVATITGTAGWEAMLLGKPAIIIGEVPYTAVDEGFIQCQDLSQLHIALEKAKTLETASDESLTRFIASIMKIGIRIPDELIWRYSEEVCQKNTGVSQKVAQTLLSTARQISTLPK